MINPTEERRQQVSEIMNDCQNKLRQLLGRPVSLNYNIRINDISEEHIIQTVCKVCGVTWSQLMEKSSKQVVVVPKKLIAWLVTYYCGTKQEQIAPLLNMDRSTISHYISDVNDMLDTKDELYVTPLTAIENCILKLTKD